MDRRIEILAQEVGPIIRVRELEKERARIEKLPAPEKTVTFKGWLEEKGKILEEEMAQIPKNIVSVASNNIASVYSDESLLEEAFKIFQKEIIKMIAPAIMIQYLPILGTILEDAVYGRTLSIYGDRFRDIDNEIRICTQKIPKPFSPELINVEDLMKVSGTKGLRFPSDRCPMDGGRYYDSWATEVLKCKPIFFDSPNYIEKQIECNKIYLREFQKEQAIEQERLSKIPPLPPPGPAPGPLF